MKRVLLFIALFFGLQALSAQESFEILLYPDGAPQKSGLETEGVDVTKAQNNTVAKMDVYLPEKTKANGQVVIVCPGGGYSGLAAGYEGADVAKFFVNNGIASMVLWYRMPNGHHEIPINDVHRTIEITRANASKWGINPNKLGVMGFSAGGHLASTAATQFTEATRPNFSILIYPVITMKGSTHGGSRTNLIGENPSAELIDKYSSELQVTAQTPPTFIALSDDDKPVPPCNSTRYYEALNAAGIPAELHIYPTGGHGWGFLETWIHKDEFRTSLLRWLSDLK